VKGQEVVSYAMRSGAKLNGRCGDYIQLEFKKNAPMPKHWGVKVNQA